MERRKVAEAATTTATTMTPFSHFLIITSSTDHLSNIIFIMLSKLPLFRSFFQPFSTKKIEIFINNKPYQVDNNLSIFQAAKENGIEIPRFCYH